MGGQKQVRDPSSKPGMTQQMRETIGSHLFQMPDEQALYGNNLDSQRTSQLQKMDYSNFQPIIPMTKLEEQRARTRSIHQESEFEKKARVSVSFNMFGQSTRQGDTVQEDQYTSPRNGLNMTSGGFS